MPKLGKLRKLPDDLAELIPVYGPDQRQETFLNNNADAKILANIRRGFPAAYVDIGFLQWLTVLVWQRDKFAERDAMKAVVGYSIQRVGSITIAQPTAEDTYDIRFTTNDDYGQYHYAFLVNFKESYPIPDFVYRQMALLRLDDEKKGKKSET